MNWLAIFIISGGIFSIVGAALDWDWFMTHRKARLFVRLFGRNGARVFYVGLGTVLIGLGVAAFLNGP